MNTDDYKEYCRCWWIYLDKIDNDMEFTRYVRNELHWVKSIQRFPTVWPEVSYLFTARKELDHVDVMRNFISIIRLAEKQSSSTPT